MKQMRLPVLLVLLSFCVTLAYAQSPLPQGDNIYPEGVVSFPTGDRFSQYIFVVGKKERTLWVYQKDGERMKMLEKFETDMGKSAGEKTKQNDHKTPTGIYFLETRKSQPEIPFETYGSMAFTTDYPNIFDQREAKTGYGIWLHAVPDTVPLTRGSRGCVVVRNAVIKKLEPYIRMRQTPIVIFNEVKFLNYEQFAAQKKRYMAFFNEWKRAWAEQDVNSYIRFYDTSFKNDKMSYKQWYRHKRNLKSVYQYIKVELSEPLIIQNKNQVVMRTLQNYESDRHKDFGEKTIHARATTNDGLFGFKIIREDWKGINLPINPVNPINDQAPIILRQASDDSQSKPAQPAADENHAPEDRKPASESHSRGNETQQPQIPKQSTLFN